jgi:hypothetical protein
MKRGFTENESKYFMWLEREIDKISIAPHWSSASLSRFQLLGLSFAYL